jgi:hypothetical protein
MIATIIKSTLLGLTLGIALAYAGEPEAKRDAQDYTRASGSPSGRATGPRVVAAAEIVTLPKLPLAKGETW